MTAVTKDPNLLTVEIEFRSTLRSLIAANLLKYYLQNIFTYVLPITNLIFFVCFNVILTYA